MRPDHWVGSLNLKAVQVPGGQQDSAPKFLPWSELTDHFTAIAAVKSAVDESVDVVTEQAD